MLLIRWVGRLRQRSLKAGPARLEVGVGGLWAMTLVRRGRQAPFSDLVHASGRTVRRAAGGPLGTLWSVVQMPRVRQGT